MNMSEKSTYDRMTEDPSERRLLRQEELILDVTEALVGALADQGMRRSQLASKLGRTKGYVSQMLAGSRNLTLRSVADLADALDCRVRVSIAPRPEEHVYTMSVKGNEISSTMLRSTSAAPIERSIFAQEGAGAFEIRDAAFTFTLPATPRHRTAIAAFTQTPDAV